MAGGKAPQPGSGRFKPGKRRIYPEVVAKQLSPNVSARGASPRLIVLHSTESHNREGASDIQAILALFARSATQASSHIVVDADGTSGRSVKDALKAWTQGNLNPWCLSIEQIGFAAQGRRSWRECDRELHETARWIALWSRRHGIPIQKAKLTGGGSIVRPGVTTHWYLSKHGAGTDHWDPGDYPMGYVLWLARGYRRAQEKAAR